MTLDDSDTDRGMDGLESCARIIVVGSILFGAIFILFGRMHEHSMECRREYSTNTALRTWLLIYWSSCAHKSTADSSALCKIH